MSETSLKSSIGMQASDLSGIQGQIRHQALTITRKLEAFVHVNVHLNMADLSFSPAGIANTKGQNLIATVPYFRP